MLNDEEFIEISLSHYRHMENAKHDLASFFLCLPVASYCETMFQLGWHKENCGKPWFSLESDWLTQFIINLNN